MSKFRISLVVMATIAVLAALAIGGVALAQSTPTPNAPTASSTTAWVGISLADLNEKVAARIGVSQTTGVAIVQVIAKSPAADAGLKVGDIVTGVDSKTVATAADVVTAVKAKKVGDQVAFTVSRGGSSVLINVTTGAAPAAPQRGNATGGGAPNASGRGLGDFGFGFGFMGRGQLGLGGLLDNLKGLTPGDLFGHILGGQEKFTDKDGNIVTVKTIPGTIVSASKDTITIKPNDNTETATVFAITANTKVQLPGRAAVESLKAGDQVVVVTTDGKTALTVMQGPAGSLTGNSAGTLRDRMNGLRNRLPNRVPDKVTPAPSGTRS